MQELRGWRDRIGAAPSALLPARLEAEGYERTAAHVARLARCESSRDGDEPVATVAVPGGSVAVLRDRRGRPRSGGAQGRPAPRAGSTPRSRGPSSKLANEGFVAKAPAAVVEAEREKLARLREERDGVVTVGRAAAPGGASDLLGLELFGMRFGLERMRRLLTALGSPQERFGAIHVVGTNGKSSTVRMTAALLEAHGVRTGAFLSPHLDEFAERIRIGDADLEPDDVRRRGASAPRAAAAKVDRGLEEGDRVTQFEVLTAAAFDELARRGRRGRGGRGRPRRAPRRHGRAARAGRRAHQRRPRAHALARADDRATSRARSSRWCRRARRSCSAKDAEVEALAEATGARIVVRRARRRRGGSGGPAGAFAPGYQRTNFAVACAAAHEHLGAELDPDAVARWPRGSPCRGGCRSWASGR